MIFSFLGFICKRYIFHQLKGNANSVFIIYGASQYYATATKREILINQAEWTLLEVKQHKYKGNVDIINCEAFWTVIRRALF